MPFCKYCGRKIEEGEVCACRTGRQTREDPKSSEYFSFKIDPEKIRDIRDSQRMPKGPGGVYERQMPIVNQCIAPEEEEIPIRQYDIAVLRTIFPYKRAEGRLQVTNKRVVFRATGKSWLGTSFFENEFSLSEIAGIEIRKDSRVNGWLLLIGALIFFVMSYLSQKWFYVPLLEDDHKIAVCVLAVLFGLGAIALAVLVRKLFWLKTGLFGMTAVGFILRYIADYYYELNKFYFYMAVLNFIAALVFYFFYVHTEDLVIRIKVNNAANAVEIRRMKRVLLLYKTEEYSGFAEVLPWKDTDTAARELEALINDVKRYGNAGIAKWRR